MKLTKKQIYRYSRQIILSEIGGKGQKKLMDSGLRLYLLETGSKRDCDIFKNDRYQEFL